MPQGDDDLCGGVLYIEDVSQNKKLYKRCQSVFTGRMLLLDSDWFDKYLYKTIKTMPSRH
jgi:hypothetical protein